jgi:ankyrin repeat protein
MDHVNLPSHLKLGQRSLFTYHSQVVDYLLDMSEVNVNRVDTLFGETALTAAASRGLADLCVKLMRRGATVEVGDMRDAPALIRAIKEGHWEAADVIVSQGGACVDQADGQKRTALMVAACEGHVALVEMLLARGKPVAVLELSTLNCIKTVDSNFGI